MEEDHTYEVSHKVDPTALRPGGVIGSSICWGGWEVAKA